MADLFNAGPVLETVDVLGDGSIKKAVLQRGEGEKPAEGEEVWAHYTGKLDNGTEFDSSRKRGKPFVFQVGIGQVVGCWDHGFLSMQKGEKAVLSCEPRQGYGSRGAGGVIPPNAKLHFEVELVDFGKPGEVSRRQGGADDSSWCSVQ